MKSHPNITGNHPQTIRKSCQHHEIIAPEPRWSFHNHAKATPILTWPSANSPWPSAIRPTSWEYHPQTLKMSPRKPCKVHPATMQAACKNLAKASLHNRKKQGKHENVIPEPCKVIPKLWKCHHKTMTTRSGIVRTHPKFIEKWFPNHAESSQKH